MHVCVGGQGWGVWAVADLRQVWVGMGCVGGISATSLDWTAATTPFHTSIHMLTSVHSLPCLPCPQAIETASDLTRLFIRGANLTGALPCAFVESHPLKALFVGFNKVGGPLPGCYLKSTTLQEFSATNTRLTGGAGVAGWVLWEPVGWGTCVYGGGKGGGAHARHQT